MITGKRRCRPRTGKVFVVWYSTVIAKAHKGEKNNRASPLFISPNPDRGSGEESCPTVDFA
eukprot:2102524-Prymnesium_polylepis.1